MDKKNNLLAICLQCPLLDGLTKADLFSILSKMPDEEELTCFFTSANNSSAIGFMSIHSLNEANLAEENVLDFINHILEDKERENNTCLYRIKDSYCVYIGYSSKALSLLETKKEKKS